MGAILSRHPRAVTTGKCVLFYADVVFDVLTGLQLLNEGDCGALDPDACHNLALAVFAVGERCLPPAAGVRQCHHPGALAGAHCPNSPPPRRHATRPPRAFKARAGGQATHTRAKGGPLAGALEPPQ